MKTAIPVFIFLAAMLAPSQTNAIINGYAELKVDFTSPTNAYEKATWADPSKLIISGSGLAWDGNPQQSRDTWIQTKPIALGEWWRAPSAGSVRVAIYPPTEGTLYLRYSPDLEHWSSWQALQSSTARSLDEKKAPGSFYETMFGVPEHEQQDYRRLLSEYSRLDVPWRSDEEAAVRWILTREPDFFAQHIPFIGYVEVLFEGRLHGGERIRSLSVAVSYSMSGLSAVPKDEASRNYQDHSRWRFATIDPLKAEPGGPANGSQPIRSLTNSASSPAGSRR
jgi:hypothetical protein